MLLNLRLVNDRVSHELIPKCIPEQTKVKVGSEEQVCTFTQQKHKQRSIMCRVLIITKINSIHRFLTDFLVFVQSYYL